MCVYVGVVCTCVYMCCVLCQCMECIYQGDDCARMCMCVCVCMYVYVCMCVCVCVCARETDTYTHTHTYFQTGIGPCYASKATRNGVRMGAIVDFDDFKAQYTKVS